MWSIYVQAYHESNFNLTLTWIVELVQTHYNPKPSIFVQRLKFSSYSRQQSVSAFIAHLRQLTEYCDLDHSLEVMLCDRLVCGINDAHIQQWLLQDHDMTFETALKLSSDGHWWCSKFYFSAYFYQFSSKEIKALKHDFFQFFFFPQLLSVRT